MPDVQLNQFLTPLFATLGILLTAFLIWTLLRRHRSPTSTFAWIMAIVLLPYVGIPLYLLLGGRKMGRFTKHKDLVREDLEDAGHTKRSTELLLMPSVSGVYPTTSCEEIELFTKGDSAFHAVLGLIDNASDSIDICTYILGYEDTGHAIVQALTEKASQGVVVRVLIDSYGSMAFPSRILAPLLDAGGQVSFFLPILRIPFLRRLNLRNHRKMLLIDKEVALIGGMNLAINYMGSAADANYWVDMSMRLAGPGVAHLHEVFESDWAFSRSEELPQSADHTEARAGDAEALSQFIASGPDVAGDPIHDAILVAMFGARQRIWIVSPYILPDESLLKAMTIAAQRGIDLRLITPLRSNHRVADFAREGYLMELEKAGAQIFYYTMGMLHGKAMIIDDRSSFVGSANLDMRSMFFNFEIAAAIESKSLCDDLEEWMVTLLNDSKKGVTEKNRLQQAWYGLGRLLAPIL